MAQQIADSLGFTRYADFRPTAFDGHIELDGREDWAVAPVAQNRDSGCWEQSNFAQFLEGLGGESESVEVHRFGHWGPGWFEIIIFDPSDERVAKAAYDMEAALENYPVLDDEDLSQREYDDFQDSWDNWGRRDFQRAMERDLQSMGCDATAGFISDLDSHQVDEIWALLAEHLGWEYQHDSGGCIINLEGAMGVLGRDKYAEIVRRYR